MAGRDRAYAMHPAGAIGGLDLCPGRYGFNAGCKKDGLIGLNRQGGTRFGSDPVGYSGGQLGIADETRWVRKNSPRVL